MSNQSIDTKPIGQILVEAGLISLSQLGEALAIQKNSNLKLGEILVLRGWIEKETVSFFVNKWSILPSSRNKKPLHYYLQQAKLIDLQQINEIAHIQQKQLRKERFHRLALEQGYLKQATVDYFLAHIFKVYDRQKVSRIKPYELIENYTKGETNFIQSNLAQAPLTSISLKGVNLNDSCFVAANLSKANISHSNLIRVDFSFANLTKAIFTNLNLTESYLIKANLQQIHLVKSNLQSAILHQVNLQSAYLSQVNFAGADLTNAKLSLAHYDNIYYDRDTIFDSGFNPQLAGWKMIGY